MHCDHCKYSICDPDAAVCRRCGRYGENKAAQIAFFAGAALALAIFSHYILTGRIFGGERLLWVHSALTIPGSIYCSNGYLAAVGLSLAGLLAMSVLAGFHYGAGLGLVIGVAAGMLSGVHLGGVVMGLAAVAAGLLRAQGVPAPVWPILAVAAGGCHYIYLAASHGPQTSDIHRRALLVFMAGAALAALAAVTTAVLLSARAKYRSSYLTALAVFALALPVTTGLAASRPSVIEANIVLTIYAPERALENPLGEGFASGQANQPAGQIVPEKQLGHVFETLEYVDAVRARAIEACDDYLRRHGDAPAAAEVLLLKAAMHNARVDLSALKRLNRLECYFDRVTAEAQEACRVIIERFPETTQAALARFQIAQGTFQRGQIREAEKLFAHAREALSNFVPADFNPAGPKRPSGIADLFKKPSAGELRRLDQLYDALVKTHRTLSLIAHNADYGGQPLARLAGLDERSADFEREATALAAGYPDSVLQDNVRLILAERLRDPLQRLGALEGLLEKYAASDVTDKMLLAVARAYLAGDLTGTGATKAELALRRLLADYPQSTYAGPARRLLSQLQTAVE